MSVYSGIIDLEDLNLKKNLFSKLNIPLKLVIGKIQRLYVIVPWSALSSKPVQLEITGLQILMQPLDRGDPMAENSPWLEFVKSQNSNELIEKKLIEYLTAIFQDMLKASLKQDA